MIASLHLTALAQTPAPVQPSGPTANPDAGTVHLADDQITIDFTDQVELKILIQFAIDTLKIPIVATDGGLSGQTVVLTSPVTLRTDELLPFLAMLLEQKGYALTRDVGGIFVIRKSEDVQPMLGDSEFTSTRVIPTPGLRPSALNEYIAALTGQGGPGAGVTPNDRVARAGRIAFVDDLGLLIVTDTPRKTQAVADLVDRLVAERARVKLSRLPLKHIAAPVARQRLIELAGSFASGRSSRSGGAGNVLNEAANNPASMQALGLSPSNSLSNLGERLIVEPQDNALLFRGRLDELESVRELLDLVDSPNRLLPKWYGVGGRAAWTIATRGRQQGLGEMQTVDRPGSSASNSSFGNNGAFAFDLNAARGDAGLGALGLGRQNQSDMQGGSVFIVDLSSGGFIYYGTPEQHDVVARIVEDLQPLTKSELVVYEFYKLKHATADNVAEIIQGLLSNTVPSSSSSLLSGDSSRRGALGVGGSGGRNDLSTRNDRFVNANGETVTDAAAADSGGEGSVAQIRGGEDTFVLADSKNNQVVVKAPSRLQPQFKKLVDSLDLRRPQVYIDAKIVAVTASDDFRLAFETQLLSAKGEGGVFNTNFGLSTFPANGAITTPKTVATTLLGGTAALIRSDQVPIIISALASNVDTRILSSPQILVDDNEEAEITSVDKQPFTQTSQGTSTTQTSFAGNAEAGTKFTVKPQISEGDYLKVKYNIELSSFTGQSAQAGVPPPSQENKIKSDAVAVPSDATIVVGGLTFDNLSNTTFKVPLLGDIPIIGQLFKDERKTDRKTTLYIFLTPRIMRDPSFADLRLLTKGPKGKAKLPTELPPIEVERIDILGLPPTRPDRARPTRSPDTPQPELIDLEDTRPSR
ncbi:MAG: hypothetical protein JNM07_05185 [Phycisphaerae bacterium]|nr:hypothetical protein [Phycisphaerae bacterium]